MLTEGEFVLSRRWHDAADLRREFPYMGDLLRGGFNWGPAGAIFNVYENGRVVSRELVETGVGIKYPTVGVILPGEYHFGTGNNTETLTVLDGELKASVNHGPTSSLFRDGTIVAPAGSTLNLGVRSGNLCFYICQYQPRGGGK